MERTPGGLEGALGAHEEDRGSRPLRRQDRSVGGAIELVAGETAANTVRAWGAARAVAAILTFAALGVQLHFELHKGAAYGPAIVIGNFFGAFTYFSGTITALVLTYSALVAMRGRTSAFADALLLTCAANVAFVGIFYNIMLRSTTPADSITWVNESLHVLLPIYVVTDAVFASRRQIPVRACWSAGMIAFSWALATQVRGAIVSDPERPGQGWYPYSFVDPVDTPGGVVGTLVVSLVLTALIAAIAFLLRALSNQR